MGYSLVIFTLISIFEAIKDDKIAFNMSPGKKLCTQSLMLEGK